MHQRSKEFFPYFEMGIRKDEDISGWFREVANYRTSGTASLSEIDQRYAQYGGWIHPGSLKRLVEFFPDTLPSADVLIRNHTRYPVYEAILGPDKAAQLWSYHVDALVTPFRSISTSLSGPLGARMGICPDCLESDLEGGYPIWHRQFLMPGALVCDIHAQPLMTFCDVCESTVGADIWRLRLKCICNTKLKKIASLTPVERVANQSYVANITRHLSGKQPKEVTGANIIQAVQYECGKKSQNFETPAKYLHSALVRHLGSSGIQRLQFTSNVIRRLSGAMSAFHGQSLQNPIQMITIMDAVFLDVEHFKATLAEARQKQLDPLLSYANRKPRADLNPEEIVSRTKEARDWLEAAISANPSISRTELHKLSGFDRNVLHSLRYDRDWYEQKIPVRPKPGMSSPMRLAQRVDDTAVALVTHIKKRQKLGLSIMPPIRITARFVLSNAPKGKQGVVRSHPEVLAALAEVTECDQKWKMRRIEVICSQVALLDPNHKFADPASYLHLSGLSLWDKISRVRRWVTS